MAGYKLQGKTSDGSVVDIPLAATYDANGNDIAATYITKDEVATQLATIEEIIKYRLPLAIATWEQIGIIGALGAAPQVWDIGDEKEITLTTGEKIIVQIWDFNHDTLTGGGKAPISFGLKDALSTAYKMNSTNTNVNGWGGCEMRTNTLATIYNYLPEDVKAVIKAVDKKTSAGNATTTINTTSDKLWLPSQEEVFGTVLYMNNERNSFPGEGFQYKIFAESPLPSVDNCSPLISFNSSGKGTFHISKDAPDDDTIGYGFSTRYGRGYCQYDDDYPHFDCWYPQNLEAIKGRGKGALSSSWWWLRSPYYGDSGTFCYVSVGGNAGYYGANDTDGLVFGFCV